MIAKERSAITEVPLILRHGDPEQRPPVAAGEGHVGSLGGRSGTVEVADDDGIEGLANLHGPLTPEFKSWLRAVIENPTSATWERSAGGATPGRASRISSPWYARSAAQRTGASPAGALYAGMGRDGP